VDGYCERLSAGFWAEPANALTNLAFLLAAGFAAAGLRRVPGRAPFDLIMLVALLTAIGLGSFLFHTLATGWAALADTLPIALFMFGYLVVFVRRFGALRWRLACLAAPAFVLFVVAVGAASRALSLPVPGLYLPALLGLALLTGWLAISRDPVRRAYRRPFAVATALFAVSLSLRQLDTPLCHAWPLGTHFGWHLCNAAVLYLLLRTATRRAAQTYPLPVTESR
jgi:hypothetical protein